MRKARTVRRCASGISGATTRCARPWAAACRSIRSTPTRRCSLAGLALPEAAGAEWPESSPEADPCLSSRRKRAFVGTAAYPTSEKLEAALGEAKQALPEVESAYKPSGRTTVAAVLAFLVVTPILGEKDKKKTENWLAFSAQLDRATAERLRAAISEP